MKFMQFPAGSWFDRQKNERHPVNFLSQEKLSRLLIDRPELRLSEDPMAVQLIELAKNNTYDVNIQEMLARKITAAQQAYQASGDAFWGNMPAVEQLCYPPGFRVVGKTSNGVEMGLADSDFTLNVLIPGPTGSGKSTTFKALLSPDMLRHIGVIMFVKKPEWRGYLVLPEYTDLVYIFQLCDIAVSFGQSPGGVPTQNWHNDLSKLTGQNYERVSAHRLMNESLHRLAGKLPPGKGVALSQLIEDIDTSKMRMFSRRADLRESIIACLTELNLSVGNIFEYGSSTFLDEIFACPGLKIFELMTLSPQNLSLLVTFFSRWLYNKCLYAGPHPFPVVFVIDDATVNVCQARDDSNPGGVAPIPESMVIGRALNIGYSLLVHDLSNISSLIRQNSQTIIIKGLPGESNYLLKNNLDMNNEQTQLVKTLPRDKAIFLNRGLWPKPTLITIENPNIPETCPYSLMRQVADNFLRRVKTTPPYPIASADSSKSSSSREEAPQSKHPEPVPSLATFALDAKELEFLMVAAQVPPLPLSGIYKKLKLSNTQGRRLVNKAVANGLIVLHALATGRRGGKLQLPEVTEAGWNILQQKKCSRPKDRTQGSWLHKAAASLIEDDGKSQQETVTFEVFLDGCRMDVLRVNSATHLRTFYNIGISTPDYEAQAIIKFFATLAAVGADFVLVTETTAFAEKVVDCLKKNAEGKSVLNRFTTRLIGSFVKV